jgi:hypothetical protein
MSKRGQFTIFVIIGIVLVILVAVSLVFFGDDIGSQIAGTFAAPSEIDEARDIVQECLDVVVPAGLQFIGGQGGYFNVPESFYLSEIGLIGYAYYDGDNKFLSLDSLSDQYELYLEEVVPACVEGQSFGDLNVVAKDLDINIKYGESVEVEIYMPLEVDYKGELHQLGDPYSYEFFVDLVTLHESVNKIVDQIVANPIEDDLAVILGLGYSVDIIPVEENVILYAVTDFGSQVNGDPYVFVFATHYNFDVNQEEEP